MKKLVFYIALGTSLFQQQSSKSQTRPPWNTPPVCSSLCNPLKPDPSSLKEAKTLYMNTCGPCHGEKGKGDGVGALACNPSPADHTSDYVQKETDGSLYWKISEGKGSMPSYKNMLTEKQRWELVSYIRTLKGKK